jgi:hypothetical protein
VPWRAQERLWAAELCEGSDAASGIVDDAIEDRIGKRRIANDIMPAIDRRLFWVYGRDSGRSVWAKPVEVASRFETPVGAYV